jgi:hypothetical protein
MLGELLRQRRHVHAAIQGGACRVGLKGKEAAEGQRMEVRLQRKRDGVA